MPPRSELRRGPQRVSRSESPIGTIDDASLWPDEGSDTDPEYIPSETDTDTDTEYETESAGDDTDYYESDSE